jgi:hypothetical protein
MLYIFQQFNNKIRVMRSFISCLHKEKQNDGNTHTMVSEGNLYGNKRFGILPQSYINEYFVQHTISSSIRDYRSCWCARPYYKRNRTCSRLFPFFRGRSKEGHFNQTYTSLIGIRLQSDNEFRLELCTHGGLRPDELKFFDGAMRHLEKKRGDEYKEWDEINKNLRLYNVLSGEILIFLRELISKRMKEIFLKYREEIGEPTVDNRGENYYNLLEILRQTYSLRI